MSYVFEFILSKEYHQDKWNLLDEKQIEALIGYVDMATELLKRKNRIIERENYPELSEADFEYMWVGEADDFPELDDYRATKRILEERLRLLV